MALYNDVYDGSGKRKMGRRKPRRVREYICCLRNEILEKDCFLCDVNEIVIRMART